MYLDYMAKLGEDKEMESTPLFTCKLKLYFSTWLNLLIPKIRSSKTMLQH